MAIAAFQESPTSDKKNRIASLSISDLCIVAAVYLASFLIVAGFPHPLMAFPLDDSWIHQVVARNLAHYGTLGFIPGVWSSGSSSLLWTIVLAVNWKFFPALNPVIYSGILNLLFLIAIGLGLLVMARKDGLPKSSCWIWALTPALNGNFIWLGLIGMEHVLFVMLSVLGIYLWFQTGLRSTFLCALCLGALSLTRPEGLVLTALAVIAYRFAHRGRRDILILISIVSICVAAFLTTNLLTSHSWLPMTYAGRKWLYFGSTHVPLKAELQFPILNLLCTVRPWKATGTNLMFLFPSALMVFGIYRLFVSKNYRTATLCLWMILLIGIYAIMLPSLFDEGRYQPLLSCLLLPLILIALNTLLDHISKNKAAKTGLLIVVCVACAVRSSVLWRHVLRAGDTLVQETHERAAAFIAESLPSNAKVAALDIGAIAYFDGPERIVDLGGLTDSSYLPFMREQRIGDYLSARKISYLMWVYNPDGTPGLLNHFDITSQLKSREQLAMFCSKTADWKIVRYHAQCQVIYRIKP
jgi:hypothetical protein